MLCDKSLGDLRGTSIQAVAWCCLAPGHSPNKSRPSFTTSCEVTTHLTRLCTLVRTLMTKKWIESWCRISGIIVQSIANLHTTIITRIDTTVQQHVNPDRSRASAILTHLPPGQNGRHFTDDVFRCIFVNEKFCISSKISLKFICGGPIDNNPALIQIMAWRRKDDKPLSEP